MATGEWGQHDACPSCASTAVVGVEVWGVYDGVLYWSCASCNHRWHRFPEGDARRARAVRYLTGIRP